MQDEYAAIEGVITEHRDRILRDWLSEFTTSSKPAAIGGTNVMTAEGRDLLDAISAGIGAGGTAESFDTPVWNEARAVLDRVSETRAVRGASAKETSRYILALKRPLFVALQERLGSKPNALFAAVWEVTSLVDQIAQHTVSTFQRSREEVISRQQQELLELSTPVVKLWDSVLAVPMIGTLDSNRTQLVMEFLLQRIVETGSELAIIDITGVPTVDTLVAQHLLKTVTAIRLMGADCIISGVRPQIAQTIVHLGIELKGITTKATLADALALALKQVGYSVSRAQQ